ncbi:MAG TPA: CYTH domain-containing protein [Povalibacter sp.]|uniref:CYTH domain-containing protein n=1 Tax=Povalibacter sp. TaxID=1962978 RepID=UPI002BD64A26|nr:CYTH domain-containing protein [Povalibacter sp.]HMN44821.1 CYTH domain-containing protein [Povalibacter sp.]
MPLEIERKFLVKSDAWRSQVDSRELMRQGYLNSGAACSIRARIAGEQAWLNLKAKRSGMTRLEFEYPVPRADADQILDELCTGPLVEKYRHRIPMGELVWEIDEFLGANAGLIVAEIELPSEDAVFARPDWLGEEVTEDERYYNFNLAQKPYREWR